VPEERKGLTYAASGVDIGAADKAKKALIKALEYRRPAGLGAPIPLTWGYAGLVDFGEHALALTTDGVGTKVEVAAHLQRWETIGIDCVAMNVNDLVCVGAEPLAMVDYIVLPAPDAELAQKIAAGLSEGARQSNISIIGGETAIMPDLVKGVDLSGTAMGVVRKDRIVDGGRIKPGDVIIGLESSGVHSNGLTLARRVLREAGLGYADAAPWDAGLTWGEALLTPTRIYVKPILELLASSVAVHGLAHITGGGVTKLSRLTKKFEFLLDAPLKPPPVFSALQKLGGVDTKEMYRTFNMGMGFACIVPDGQADDALRVLNKHVHARVVGRMAVGSGVWYPSMDLRFGA
jgi:phosphoribosylformylglycinamidine cyclo-ligase